MQEERTRGARGGERETGGGRERERERVPLCVVCVDAGGRVEKWRERGRFVDALRCGDMVLKIPYIT